MKEEIKTKEYEAGYDAGLNGANLINCDFRLFATPGQTKEWERGNKEGLKNNPPNFGGKRKKEML